VSGLDVSCSSKFSGSTLAQNAGKTGSTSGKALYASVKEPGRRSTRTWTVVSARLPLCRTTLSKPSADSLLNAASLLNELCVLGLLPTGDSPPLAVSSSLVSTL